MAALQLEHRGDAMENLARARTAIAEAARGGAHLVVLPEYFFASFSTAPMEEAAAVEPFLRQASLESHCTVVGNTLAPGPAGLQNVGLVAHGGRIELRQPKIHPMPREVAGGIVGGDRLTAASAHPDRPSFGLLVCADILVPEAARILQLQGADILLNPVMSPRRPAQQDPDRLARESVYVARAYDSRAFVVKASGFRRGDPAIAGRSLIAAPWGMLAHYRDDEAPETLVADLDFTALAAFRAHQAGFPARRPETYGDLLQ